MHVLLSVLIDRPRGTVNQSLEPLAGTISLAERGITHILDQTGNRDSDPGQGRLVLSECDGEVVEYVMGHELLMQGFECIVIEAYGPVLESLALHPGDANDDPVLQVYAIFAVSFEVVPMVDLVDALAVLQPPLDQFLHQLDALLLELCQEAEELEPVIGL